MASPAPLLILVDGEVLSHPAVQALIAKGHAVAACGLADLVLSKNARYFEPEWWDDPKQVEVALKRARVEKRKRRR